MACGYEVTMKAFIEADPTKPEKMRQSIKAFETLQRTDGKNPLEGVKFDALRVTGIDYKTKLPKHFTGDDSDDDAEEEEAETQAEN